MESPDTLIAAAEDLEAQIQAAKGRIGGERNAAAMIALRTMAEAFRLAAACRARKAADRARITCSETDSSRALV